MRTVYLSLGSNLGDRSRNIEAALGLLEPAGVRILRRSALYETEPQDLPDQPWFFNLVVEAETALSPSRLLRLILRVERQLGRRRLVPKGPRLIDIDILLYGSAIICAPHLAVPHPRLLHRRFVLEPLLELAPQLAHPVTGQPLAAALAALRGQVVRRVAPPDMSS